MIFDIGFLLLPRDNGLPRHFLQIFLRFLGGLEALIQFGVSGAFIHEPFIIAPPLGVLPTKRRERGRDWRFQNGYIYLSEKRHLC